MTSRHISEIMAEIKAKIAHEFELSRVFLPKPVQLNMGFRDITIEAGWHIIETSDGAIMTPLRAMHLCATGRADVYYKNGKIKKRRDLRAER